MPVHHLVLLRFKDDTTAAQRAAIEAAFAALPVQIAEVSGFEWGINNSPEGLSKGFTHAFVLTFVDEIARDAYLRHPAHLAFVEVLKPRLADVLVLDYLPRSR